MSDCFIGLIFDVNDDPTQPFRRSGPSFLPHRHSGPKLAALEYKSLPGSFSANANLLVGHVDGVLHHAAHVTKLEPGSGKSCRIAKIPQRKCGRI